MHSATHAAHQTQQHAMRARQSDDLHSSRRRSEHPVHPPLPASIRPARAPAATARRPSVHHMTYQGKQIKVTTYGTREEAIAAKEEEARKKAAAEKAKRERAKRAEECQSTGLPRGGRGGHAALTGPAGQLASALDIDRQLQLAGAWISGLPERSEVKARLGERWEQLAELHVSTAVAAGRDERAAVGAQVRGLFQWTLEAVIVENVFCGVTCAIKVFGELKKAVRTGDCSGSRDRRSNGQSVLRPQKTVIAHDTSRAPRNHLHPPGRPQPSRIPPPRSPPRSPDAIEEMDLDAPGEGKEAEGGAEDERHHDDGSAPWPGENGEEERDETDEAADADEANPEAANDAGEADEMMHDETEEEAGCREGGDALDDAQDDDNADDGSSPPRSPPRSPPHSPGDIDMNIDPPSPPHDPENGQQHDGPGPEESPQLEQEGREAHCDGDDPDDVDEAQAEELDADEEERGGREAAYKTAAVGQQVREDGLMDEGHHAGQDDARDNRHGRGGPGHGDEKNDAEQRPQGGEGQEQQPDPNQGGQRGQQADDDDDQQQPPGGQEAADGQDGPRSLPMSPPHSPEAVDMNIDPPSPSQEGGDGEQQRHQLMDEVEEQPHRSFEDDRDADMDRGRGEAAESPDDDNGGQPDMDPHNDGADSEGSEGQEAGRDGEGLGDGPHDQQHDDGDAEAGGGGSVGEDEAAPAADGRPFPPRSPPPPHSPGGDLDPHSPPHGQDNGQQHDGPGPGEARCDAHDPDDVDEAQAEEIDMGEEGQEGRDRDAGDNEVREDGLMDEGHQAGQDDARDNRHGRGGPATGTCRHSRSSIARGLREEAAPAAAAAAASVGGGQRPRERMLIDDDAAQPKPPAGTAAAADDRKDANDDQRECADGRGGDMAAGGAGFSREDREGRGRAGRGRRVDRGDGNDGHDDYDHDDEMGIDLEGPAAAAAAAAAAAGGADDVLVPSPDGGEFAGVPPSILQQPDGDLDDDVPLAARRKRRHREPADTIDGDRQDGRPSPPKRARREAARGAGARAAAAAGGGVEWTRDEKGRLKRLN
ncbi:unnamed protein product [Vitrella brassicaformis CCMP3155]|uniref:Uncharacterized protein n=1 Tax=Vitrella brassicaformis (strain CCMP3155) TaxID=1169540 RepID=A0A0G4GSB6_VITBC|nr:unnamed protein product [Vitrella brassicaformis CCMP3155]|eukprot:CEM33495.1 unnamed protein product [Vitrella brassicaformis CCMP3155]